MNTTVIKSNKLTPPCHFLTQIHPGLFIGKYVDYDEMIARYNVDILVPLDSADGSVWTLGFRGELMYIPINDYSVLPMDRAIEFSTYLANKIKEGKKVGLFCIGGHGRTGYMAALILGLLGYEDPIAHLRSKYCKDSIESSEQINQIAKILNNPNLGKYWPSCTLKYDYYWHERTITPAKTVWPAPIKGTTSNEVCGTCHWFYITGIGIGQTKLGECLLSGAKCYSNDTACDSDWVEYQEQILAREAKNNG